MVSTHWGGGIYTSRDAHRFLLLADAMTSAIIPKAA
jgi:hypothetical protein